MGSPSAMAPSSSGKLLEMAGYVAAMNELVGERRHGQRDDRAGADLAFDMDAGCPTGRARGCTIDKPRPRLPSDVTVRTSDLVELVEDMGKFRGVDTPARVDHLYRQRAVALRWPALRMTPPVAVNLMALLTRLPMMRNISARSVREAQVRIDAQVTRLPSIDEAPLVGTRSETVRPPPSGTP